MYSMCLLIIINLITTLLKFKLNFYAIFILIIICLNLVKSF